MAGPIKILIVDDSLTMRALFCGVFEGVKGLQVVDHVANADEARDAMISLKPDVVTLDIEMPGMSGLEYLEEVMRERRRLDEAIGATLAGHYAVNAHAKGRDGFAHRA